MARKLPRFLSDSEVKAMFELSRDHPRDNLLLKSMYYLGLRNSEVINLRYEDIDFINKTVKVVMGKGEKDRYVPVPSQEILDQFQAYTEDRRTGRVFLLTDRHLRRIVKNYAVKANIRNPGEIHPHTLRHSYATHLMNKGLPLNYIQELLGHSKIDTTTIYVHLGIDKKKELVTKAFSE